MLLLVRRIIFEINFIMKFKKKTKKVKNSSKDMVFKFRGRKYDGDFNIY